MKTLTSFKRHHLVIAAAVVLPAAGCALIGSLMSLLGFDVLGANPAADFTQSGQFELSMLGYSEEGSVYAGPVGEEECDVYIEDEHGEDIECEVIGGDFVEAARYNSIALVLDSSGSMERTYPEADFGDFCLTCPHDANRQRVPAAQELVTMIGNAAPDTEIGVMAFGPDPSPGWQATQVLSDFTVDQNALLSAISNVGGGEMVGTPMYDSLAELIVATDTSAGEYEALLRTVDIYGNNNTVDCSDLDLDDDDEIDIYGNNNEVNCNCSGADVEIYGNNNEVNNGCSDGSAGNGNTGSTPNPGAGSGDPGDIAVRRTIVLISDGEDLDSLSWDLEGVIDLAQQHDVTIHAIGLGPASASFDSDLLPEESQAAAVIALQQLASGTGGFYASVNDASGLQALYQRIALSLTEGYSATTVVCEEPSGSRNGTGLAFTSGQRVNGHVEMEGSRSNFSFIAP